MKHRRDQLEQSYSHMELRTRETIRRNYSPSCQIKQELAIMTVYAYNTSSIKQYLENSRIDEEGYSHILVFYKLFYQRNRKRFFFSCFHTVIETPVKVWENSK